MRDYTFADGTTVPRGTILGAPSHALHLHAAPTFDGFRFVGQPGKTLTATGPDYLAFGHGKASERTSLIIRRASADACAARVPGALLGGERD